MQVLFIRMAFCLSTGFGTGPIDHFQFVISCQIKFNFIKICMLPWYFFKAQKGQGLLSQSGSINIHTLRLWLAQQMGTHTPFTFCINIWLWGQQDLLLWQPWLMHSHQGMEMFLLQSRSALAAMLSQAISPPKQCCLLIPQTSSYIQATLNRGRGVLSMIQCLVKTGVSFYT